MQTYDPYTKIHANWNSREWNTTEENGREYFGKAKLASKWIVEHGQTSIAFYLHSCDALRSEQYIIVSNKQLIDAHKLNPLHPPPRPNVCCAMSMYAMYEPNKPNSTRTCMCSNRPLENQRATSNTQVCGEQLPWVYGPVVTWGGGGGVTTCSRIQRTPLGRGHTYIHGIHDT